jgi:hypothetical protein
VKKLQWIEYTSVQKMEAMGSFISRLSPSSSRLSLIPISSVYLSLEMRKYEPTMRIPSTKLGWMYLSEKNLSKMKDNMYISLVMKPSIPNAKWRMAVGNSSIL